MNGFIKWRFCLIMVAMLGAAVFVLIRYAMHISDGYTGRSGTQRENVERGKILDRNGKILATQVTRYNVFIRPPSNRDIDERIRRIEEMADDLAPILDMGVEDIRVRLYNTANEFIIKRNVSWETWERIQRIQNQPGNRLTGVRTVAVSLRDYPENSIASQIIGFTGNDNIGREGIEYAFNSELSSGSTIELTIDINVQYILEKVARSTMATTQAESVIFIATEPLNGDILGSAVLPNFNPNNYNMSDEKTWHNLTATSPYEPGSVFKVFSIAAMMDSGAISEHSEFACTGVYEKVFSSGEVVRIECADGRAHGRVRPREIIIYSCNVGAALAADRLDNQAFYEYMVKFGFGSKTGAWVNAATPEYPLLETAGMLKNPIIPRVWSGRTRQSIAFGQEIAVSALQIMQAASIITNSGVLVPPKITSKIISADGKTVKMAGNTTNSIRQVIKPETAQKMLLYMMDTAKEGTGQLANIRDLNLAVKTGTAELHDPAARRVNPATGRVIVYSQTDFITSCIALLPAEYPSLVLYVVIIKPRGEILGGRIAAPAIREAADELINYLGIPRPRNLIWEHSGNMVFTEESLPVISTHVPNFIGISKRTLLPLLFRSDIQTEIIGNGWVRYQSPPPGTLVEPGMVLELMLE